MQFHSTITINIIIFLLLFCIVSCDAKSENENSYRIALFNIKELSTEKLVNVDDQGYGLDEQLKAAARIISRIDADVLIIQEIDHDYTADNASLDLNANRFMSAYLVPVTKSRPYQFTFAAPCNTGILSNQDLNNDGLAASEDQIGSREYGGDCFGFGTYPGQYSMAIFSKIELDTGSVRTFQRYLWKDLNGNHLPNEYYSEEAKSILRLSSKSHWDIPVLIGSVEIHLFVSHPTPPVFDGDEDRNGRRNFDEIKFWVNYISGDSTLYDDKGIKGGSKSDRFIIIGDLNASLSSESVYDEIVAIDQLLNNPRIQDSGQWLISNGAWEGRKKDTSAHWERSTAVFGKDSRMRIDYILPSRELKITGGGVYWPSTAEDKEGNRDARLASDHRLLWLDIQVP